MNVINGLPAHIVLIHVLVVLVPLTAVLEILCGLWPAVRQRLVWLVLALAVIVVGITPITAGAGQWLYDQEKHHSAVLDRHAELGSWLLYFTVALLVVAILLVVIQVREGRAVGRSALLNIVVAFLAVVVGVASTIQIYRIGDAGARAVWGGQSSESGQH
ncbi:MAG: hypothetical protein K2Q25_07275 [Mycobacteriaceae bacterium]|nr:hypothetical protein [Mycobacteriaceae bacterium]